MSVENISDQMNQALYGILPPKPKASDKLIFRSYDKIGSSERMNNWLEPFDFSGVGWDSKRAGTLIDTRAYGFGYSLQFIVMAKHYPRAVGEDITFHLPHTGDPVHRRVADIEHIKITDLSIGRLNKPAHGCAAYPILTRNYDWQAALHSTVCFITDQERKVLLWSNNGLDPVTASFRGRNPRIPDILRESMIGGDSGNPAFLPYGNYQLCLLSTHWYGGAGCSGPNLQTDANREAIRGAIQKLVERASLVS